MDLESKYEYLCSCRSDINEHLPTLCRYAMECDHVTEAGVRYVVSTFGLMMGRPRRLVSIDIVHPTNLSGGEDVVNRGKEEFRLARMLAKEVGVDFSFQLGSTLDLEIEETDLLFIDTLHVYDQLFKELERLHTLVKKYIILHDTTTYAFFDENEQRTYARMMDGERKRGLWIAMVEFLQRHPEWKIYEQFFNNNGLTVLKKKTNP